MLAKALSRFAHHGALPGSNPQRPRQQKARHREGDGLVHSTGGELGIRAAALLRPSAAEALRASLRPMLAKALSRFAHHGALPGSNPQRPRQQKARHRKGNGLVHSTGGELGIRTPDSLVGNTRLAGEHLRPLGQLSGTVTLILAHRCVPMQEEFAHASSLHNMLAFPTVQAPARFCDYSKSEPSMTMSA